ncbi:tryptophan synthase subunit alpha [Geotalea sp. SG265]|uniref:tryptophan synthase subunit alpha n=1 Tax=Geotalea sp. SG265 TaxID=2922867 RepID=UPI001FAFBE77|nr:tryptophan synthase subunit alpha [Geotalea sp. SG265]
MGRIDNTFAALAGKGKKALVTFITAGDPDLETTESLILDLEKSGADLIELGVPFSDPMADGPTIQLSSERALAAGTTLPKILVTVKSVRRKTDIPIILMGYYNPIFMYGVERFIADAVAAGVDGVLLVDLPPEEASEFKAVADRSGLAVIFLLTPTSDEERISKVARLGSGFIYYVSVTGVTGARSSVADTVFSEVQKIRGRVPLPVVVGFGISDPAQAGAIASVADGVVVGSALVKQFEEFNGKELHARLSSMVSALKAGMSA